MDFLAQVIAELAALVTFQQRQPPARPPVTDEDMSGIDPAAKPAHVPASGTEIPGPLPP
jgi:hypothetical protein